MGTVYLVRSLDGGSPYAVKTIREEKLVDPQSRRFFLDELRLWSDLPEHPHLVGCRFFKTVGNRVAVFAEYVDGGSLSQAIKAGRLTRLDAILDAAIQAAWGLHAAHQLGLIHQDVKPGNMLITTDGLVKINDFGLARARASVEAAPEDEGGQSILVSSGGKTPAYCSPEQAHRGKLGRRTDVWSWGVSVLHVFKGEVTWKVGMAAPQALEMFLKDGPTDSQRPAMPTRLADVLRKCLQYDPGKRWRTMAEVVQELTEIYRAEVGFPYKL